MIFNMSGGGAALNFSIVGNPQPSNPKGNTIWVDTDVEITGWNFTATAPENPSNGMVWFPIGTESPVGFNALKKNKIAVYPLSAKQYVSGTWVDKTAKSYQEGAWKEWRIYLFKEGVGALVSLKNVAGYITVGKDGITCSGTKSDGLYSDVYFTLETDTTFCVEATISVVGTSADYIGSVVAKTPTAYTSTRNDQPSLATARAKMTADGFRKVYKLSLSPGQYHLGICGNIKGTIHNMWYE